MILSESDECGTITQPSKRGFLMVRRNGVLYTVYEASWPQAIEAQNIRKKTCEVRTKQKDLKTNVKQCFQTSIKISESPIVY